MKTLLLTIAVLAAFATPAFAHAHLASSVPADGAGVPAPEAITLKFSEDVELSFTGLTITGPGGEVAQGAPSLDPVDHTMLIVPVAGAMTVGGYTVAWHALATDGHKSEGSFSFVVTK
jgi:methionine-rich copper-binding protein CopC